MRRLFHVAAVRGLIGEPADTSLDTLKLCIDNVLDEIERSSNWPPGRQFQPYKSVLIPMLGTGDDGYHVQEVAPLLVERALHFFTSRRNCQLESIYFLAYSVTERVVLPGVMQQLKADLELVGS